MNTETETRLRALHLDSTLLELNPEEEAFFKSETGIQDTDELKKHIIEVQEDAYKVRCFPKVGSPRAVTLCFVFRSTRIFAFVGSGSQGSGSPGYLHIHVFSNWGRAAQMRYFSTSGAVVRINSFAEFASVT